MKAKRRFNIWLWVLLCVPCLFSLLYLLIVCPFLLSSKNKSKKYWSVLDFFIILRCENEKSSLTKLKL